MLKMFQGVTLVMATMTVGLIAGLFAAFSYSVMPGLAGAHDRTFIDVMQRINVAILNGWFGFCFFGGIVFTAVAAVLHFGGGGRAGLPWIIGGFVLYGAALAITMTVNVPLNNALEAAGDPDRIADLAAVRKRFEDTWVRWNTARAMVSIAGFGCLAWALVQFGRVLALGGK
jgi:uncharacterized membrane protein